MSAVTSDPSIFGGKPCIAGRRITVAHILRCLGAGWSVDDLCREYHLTQEQVRGALTWAGDLLYWDHGAG